MEYIRINDSKLKIICEKEDLTPYGISASSLEYSDAQSRGFIDALLNEAKSRLDFDGEKHRILVQLFPDKRGGCEIFVSRLCEPSSFTDEIKSEVAPKKQEVIQKIFFFEKLDFLLEACKRLLIVAKIPNSTVFYLAGKGYYLYLELDDEDSLCEYGVHALNEYSFLLEYGEPQSIKENLPYLNEYAKTVCTDNAVEMLARV